MHRTTRAAPTLRARSGRAVARLGALVAAVGLVSALPTAPGAADASASSTLFTPVADAQVKSSSPTKNYGALTSLRLRAGSPEYRSYLKFGVSGLTGSVSSVTLRLFVTDASPDGGSVYSVGNGWTETGITWNSAPPIGASALASAGAATLGTWVDIQLGASAIGGDGIYSFALTSRSTNSAIYSSKEGANRPQLVVVTGASGPTPPANTAFPTISGSAEHGQTLTADEGSWTGTPPLSFNDQWRQCDQAGANCADIGGATGKTYVVAATDVGKTIRVVVTASNSSGSSSASSQQTAVVDAPVNTAPPTVTGTAKEGEVLVADPGSWTGAAPITYAYQWRRCASTGTPCNDIAGATAQTYTVSTEDVGLAIAVVVTASNPAGASSASSATTAVVAPLPSPPGDPVIAAAGDIACDPATLAFAGGLGTATECRQQYTSDLLVGAGLAAVLTLGDNQYDCGGLSAFQQSYDPSWGRVKAITHPATGNHEYQASGGTGCSTGAAGYFGYFGAAAGEPSAGYYSYDIGAWHLIALNSNCVQVGGCGAGSAQETWLRADLAAHPAACTLAYWHHARFSSGAHGSNVSYDAFWQALYSAGADVVLVGHDHDYERFAPVDPSGNFDGAAGIRELVVGTGGRSQRPFKVPLPASEVRNTGFGVLELTLHATGYDWQFVSEAGATFSDSGSGTCH